MITPNPPPCFLVNLAPKAKMTFILDDSNSSLPLLQNTSMMILDALLKTVFLVSYTPLKAKEDQHGILK